ncbi:MAG: hypothetical protein ACJASX_004072 [Limisphaerales bacterium]
MDRGYTGTHRILLEIIIILESGLKCDFLGYYSVLRGNKIAISAGSIGESGTDIDSAFSPKSESA